MYDVIELKTLKELEFKSDHEKIDILLDTTLYEYPQLTTAALGLLFRHLRPFNETIDVMEHVQLLTDGNSVKIYKAIAKGAGRLKDILKDNVISAGDVPTVIMVCKCLMNT